MNVFELIGGIVMLVAAIFLVIVIIMQESATQGTNALTGMSEDSFYGKNSKSRTKQTMLAKWTKISAIVFFALVIAIDVVSVFVK